MGAQEHQRPGGGWEGAVMRPGAEGDGEVEGGPGVMSAPKSQGRRGHRAVNNCLREEGKGKEKGHWA